MVRILESFIWIIVYFIENGKRYNKIIFKYENSAMGPIFNEILVKKICLWSHEQYTGPTENHCPPLICWLKR